MIVNKYQTARIFLKTWKLKILKKEFVFYSRKKLCISFNEKTIPVNINKVYGGLKNKTWYSVFLIGSNENLYSHVSPYCKTPPLDFEYKYYTRVGSIFYDNNRIVPFHTVGDTFYWDKPQVDSDGKIKTTTIGFKEDIKNIRNQLEAVQDYVNKNILI